MSRRSTRPDGPLPGTQRQIVYDQARDVQTPPPRGAPELIGDPAAQLLVLAAIVWVALHLERRFVLFRSFGAALVGILIGMLLSNTGILPGRSPVYEMLASTGVSAAVAMILLSVDVRSVRQAGPRMLAGFAIGAAGTAIGATVGAAFFARAVGDEGWKLAGQFTGTYTGGGMNFAALARGFDTSADMFSAAVAADVALTAVWMAACLAVPVLLGHGTPSAVSSAAAGEPSGPATLEQSLSSTIRPLAITDVAALAAIAIGAVWLAGALAALVPRIPEVLWLTTIVLLVAQIPTVKALSGAAMIGNYILLLFLAANGAQSVLANILLVGPAVFWFALTTITVHGVIIFGVGSLLRIDLGTLAVASQANVGGPASAIALASARGYGDRILPGIAVGLLGYAIGNYTGFAVALLVRGWLFA